MKESQDLVHLEKLINVMINFDASSLVIKRTPEEPSYQNYHYSGQAYGRPYYNPSYNQPKEPVDLFDLCRQAPMSVSKIFEHMGWTFDDLDEAIKLIQERRENEIDIWDDEGTPIPLPQKLLSRPKQRKKQKHGKPNH